MKADIKMRITFSTLPKGSSIDFLECIFTLAGVNYTNVYAITYAVRNSVNAPVYDVVVTMREQIEYFISNKLYDMLKTRKQA